MRNGVALQRYLQRHTETELPRHTFTEPHWRNVVVIPAYRESPSLLTTLKQMPTGRGRTLVILVLNRPDSDADTQANTELRTALEQPSLKREHRGSVPVLCLNENTDLYLHDLERLSGVTPATQGVGLARKTGCDLALQWMDAGGIHGQWICCTDADATLPADYFEQLDGAATDAMAAVFPYQHMPGVDQAYDHATAVYEKRLHYYVKGLEFAGSPYAYHTLGSCMAIRASGYAHVRGFPKRAGAEDFYILNKLAKLGPIANLSGGCIQLQSRHSSRVPFGTGPAVEAIITAGAAEDARIFDHPHCFEALKGVLASLPALIQSPNTDISGLLLNQRFDSDTATQAMIALQTMGIESALDHCQRQSRSDAQFQRQFHQWFDAFRTLKFIHLLRDAGWPQQSLIQLQSLRPQFWPDSTLLPHTS